MPTNKNASIRYQVLDRCFRNTGRMYFKEDLLEECNRALLEFDPSCTGIQKRQLQLDIQFMESEQGWSIELDKIWHNRKKYYRYADPTFSINDQALDDSETEQLRSALGILSRFSGTPQFEWVNEIIPKLESKFGLIERKSEVISFDSNIDLKGLHLLTPLFHAIINQRVLAVTYQDFKSSKPYEITFHPYYLKQYNNRWFVFGLNPEKKIDSWNLALDRIVSLKETSIEYKPSDIDWEAHFYDIVGVTRPQEGKLQEIVLRFSPEAAPYVATKPLHPSQRKLDPINFETKIEVIPTKELERLILSFGDEVTVVSPQELKNRLEERQPFHN